MCGRGVRKTSAVDCDMRDMKALMLPRFAVAIPLGQSVKIFMLDEISTSEGELHWELRGPHKSHANALI
jgi:hypothetical protein